MTLTIRLDEQLKQRLERMAAAEDRSVSEYVVRAIKERLDVQCESCGRSSGTSVLPVGLSPTFQKWLDETRATTSVEPFIVTTDEAGERRVYWGCHRYGLVQEGMLLICLYVGTQPHERKFGASIPLGVITGWGWDNYDRFRIRSFTRARIR